MIDYEKIIQDTCIPNGNYTIVFLKSELLKCMKNAVTEAIPLTLKEVAKSAIHQIEGEPQTHIEFRDEDHILNLEQKILEKLVP